MAVTIVFPGGVSVEFSGLDTREAYYRTMNTLSIAMSPFKLVLDIVDLFLELQRVLEEVTGIVTDPSDFLEALQKLVRKISLIGQYIPQASVPVMINGILNTAILLLDLLDEQLDIIESVEIKIDELDAVIDLDPEGLAPVKVVLETQQADQQEEFESMVDPLNALLELVNFFLSIIRVSYTFPVISGGSVEELRAAIDTLRNFLQDVTY